VGAKSKRKGKRTEREVVALARSYGLDASREWHRAQSADARERVCDVRIGGHYYQVQISANGFQRIYRELEGVRGFFFRRDRGEWLVALRAADYLALVQGQRKNNLLPSDEGLALRKKWKELLGSPIGSVLTTRTRTGAPRRRKTAPLRGLHSLKPGGPQKYGSDSISTR